MRKLWTDEEEKVLRTMHEKKLTLEDMCRVLTNRSRDSIRGHLSHMGLAVPQAHIDIDYDTLSELTGMEAKKL